MSHYGTAEHTAPYYYYCPYDSFYTEYNKQVNNDVMWDFITNAAFRMASDVHSLSYHTALYSHYVTTPPTLPPQIITY